MLRLGWTADQVWGRGPRPNLWGLASVLFEGDRIGAVTAGSVEILRGGITLKFYNVPTPRFAPSAGADPDAPPSDSVTSARSYSWDEEAGTWLASSLNYSEGRPICVAPAHWKRLGLEDRRTCHACGAKGASVPAKWTKINPDGTPAFISSDPALEGKWRCGNRCKEKP
jgi:hypothetical protein